LGVGIEDQFRLYAPIMVDLRSTLLFYNLSQAEIQMANEGSLMRSRVNEVDITPREVSTRYRWKGTIVFWRKVGGARLDKT